MSNPEAVPPPARKRPPESLAGRVARALILLLVSVSLVLAGLLALRWNAGESTAPDPIEQLALPDDPTQLEAQIVALEKEVKRLNAANQKMTQKIRALRPRGVYLVIDTGANRLFLMRDEQILRDALISTGSGVRLSDPDKPRSWVFDTPRGELSIQRKVNEPIWTKPDWAFVEAGEDLPGNYGDRIEEGVLGDYALDMGDGYLIHGTLFERALGLHVTHGCVRMGAKDLEAVFRSVRIGTKVYII